MATRGSQMRVIFPKLPEFGSREKKALSEDLASQTQICENVLAERVLGNLGDLAFFVC